MRITFLLGLLLSSQLLTAQQVSLDSLATSVYALPDDTSKLSKLFDLAQEYYNTDLQKESTCLKEGYRLARQLTAENWIHRFESRLGANFANSGQPDSALSYFNLAERGFEKLGERRELASVFTKKRWVYNHLGKFETALDFAFKALAIYQKIKDEAGVAVAYGYIGDILYSQQKWQEAADYAQKAYDIQKRLKLQEDLAYSCQGLGDAWLQLGDYDKALAFQSEGLQIRQALQLDIDVALSLNSRGNVLKYMKRYPEALADYRKSLELARNSNFTPLLPTCVSNIGHIYNLQNEYRKALPFHLEYRRMIRQTGEMTNAPENYLLLAEAYAGIGKLDSAYFFQKLHSEIKDSLLTEETSARMSELQTQYETAQREAKIAVQSQQLKEQRTALWAILALLAVSLAAGASLYHLTRQLRKRNQEKEFLIKEIHHRVKNNLQVLSSLLHLQSRHIQDENALDAVREGQNRVDAMSLIHQKLYMGNNLTAVDMRNYLHELGDTLLDAFGLGEEQVKIFYHLDPLRLDVDTAIPLGLIINELVTNSLKYAFPAGRTGVVEITLRQESSGKLLLRVADDGAGKAGAPTLKNSTSFGANLVDILSKKLDGKIEVSTSAGGYVTEICFNKFKVVN